MLFRSTSFFAALFLGIASGLSAATFTFTATPTYTQTISPTFSVTRTFTATPTATLTSVPGTFTNTATISPSRTATSTMTKTVTSTATQTSVGGTQTNTSTVTATITASPTPSPSATATQTPTVTPGGSPVPNPALDDFEDGNLVGTNGGNWLTSFGGASSMSVTLAAGSTLTLSTGAAHCTGVKGSSVTFDYAEFLLQIFPGGTWAYLPAACPSHAITFSYKGDYAGQQIEMGLMTGGTDAYTYAFTVPDTAWHQVTVYWPDVTDPSLTPRLTATGAPWSTGVFDIRGLYFAPLDLGQPFGFSIDDVYLGEPNSNSSPAQVATALSMPVSDVNEAYSYEMDEQLTWIIILLARHCGCHPHDIITMRETMSWGQIAVNVGTTWATVIAEAQGAGLAQPVVDVSRMERGLYNGPLPAVPTPAPKNAPPSQYVIPTPTGSCP